MFVAAIHSAQRRVWLTTPYFVPGEAALMALTSAALGGLDVRLLVPKVSDSRIVTLAARSYFDQLLAAGVRVYEYGPRMLHSKALLVDDHLVSIGSANFDYRSFRLNFEVAVVCHDARLAGELERVDRGRPGAFAARPRGPAASPLDGAAARGRRAIALAVALTARRARADSPERALRPARRDFHRPGSSYTSAQPDPGMRESTMHWLLLGLAVAAFAVALNTTVSWLMALCLLLALLFCLGWILGLYSARAGARSRDETAMIDPVELRRLREQAEARKLAAQQQQSGEPPVT